MRCNICWTNTKSLAKYYVLKCKHVFCDKACLKKLLNKKQCLVCSFGKYEDIKENIMVIDNQRNNPMDFMKYSLDNLGSKLGNTLQFIEFQHNEEINILNNYSKRKTNALEVKIKQLYQNIDSSNKDSKLKEDEIRQLKVENCRLHKNIKVLQNELKESNRKNLNYQKYITKKRESTNNSNIINSKNKTDHFNKIRNEETGRKLKALEYKNFRDDDNNSEISNLLQTFGKKPFRTKTISLEKGSTFQDSKRSKVSLKEVLFNKTNNQKETLFSCFDSNVMGSLFQKF
eukprot:GAHX01001460.1.p1 GENE.GAHX01001460.1~~GAHX01001460.1.p1  ORF type:complete len:287 (+),score=55.62 GAHX01001460.1:800-1660(+)